MKDLDPLLNKYLDNPKVKAFKYKKRIKDSFENALTEALNAEKVKKQEAATHISNSRNTNNNKIITQSNTEAYHRLVNTLNLQKVLVGSYGEKPFTALVDVNQRVCIPCFKDTE